MTKWSPWLSRREALKCGLLAGVGLAAGRLSFFSTAAEPDRPLVTRQIPSSGEGLPVVGLGTLGFGRTGAPEIAQQHEVLRRLPELGGTVVDTGRSYNRAEIVIGEFFEKERQRDKLFLATKVAVRGENLRASAAFFEESFARLKTGRIDLMQIHNVAGSGMMLPVLREWKRQGKIRYAGITTYQEQQHQELSGIMRRETFDFVQLNYSIGDRAAAEELLPLAADRGIAVLVNVPFGKASLFPKVAGKALPDWAAEIDCGSWAQFLLKYVVSHPAVTCAIPGTTNVAHLADNLGGGRGRLPDAAMRRRMERYWDSLA